jgi:hypothetical protein
MVAVLGRDPPSAEVEVGRERQFLRPGSASLQLLAARQVESGLRAAVRQRPRSLSSDVCVEHVGSLSIVAGEQVAIAVERDRDRRMAHAGAHLPSS